MKKVYETPEFELKRFDIQADILFNESKIPEVDGEIDWGEESSDSINMYRSGPGFGL